MFVALLFSPKLIWAQYSVHIHVAVALLIQCRFESLSMYSLSPLPSTGDEDVPQEDRYPHLTRQYGRSQTYDADDDVPPPLPPRPPDTLNYSGGESEDSDEDRQGAPPPPPPNSLPPGGSIYHI